MLSEKLKALMEKNNLNVNRLSINTGIPYSTISDWVKGETVPKTDKLVKLAEYFNVSIEYFLSR